MNSPQQQGQKIGRSYSVQQQYDQVQQRKGSREHQRIFGEVDKNICRKERPTSYQKSNIFDKSTDERLKLRNSGTFQSSVFKQGQQMILQGGKKRISPNQKIYKVQQCIHIFIFKVLNIRHNYPLKYPDHEKQFLFHQDKENNYKAQLRKPSINNDQPFKPTYKEQTLHERRSRDFIYDQISQERSRPYLKSPTINQRNINKDSLSAKQLKQQNLQSTHFDCKVNTCITPTISDQPKQDNLNPHWRNLDQLQTSDVCNNLFKKYEQWKEIQIRKQSNSPSSVTISKGQTKSPESQINRKKKSSLIPTNINWQNYDSIKNARDFDMNTLENKFEISSQHKLYTDTDQYQDPTMASPSVMSINQHKIQGRIHSPKSPNKYYGLNLSGKLKPPERRKSSAKVDVIQLEMLGLDDQFDGNRFKHLCRDKGYHLVSCSNEYDKLTNKNTGKGQIILRGSEHVDQSFDKHLKEIKQHLKSQGIQLQKFTPSNGFKDIIPNSYIQKLQNDQQRLIDEENADYEQLGVTKQRNRNKRIDNKYQYNY